MAQPKFKFIGSLNLPKAESNKPFLKKFTKDGQEMVSMNFGVAESKQNMGFVECFGSIPKNRKIKTKDTDGNDIEINWDDRFDENILKTVAFFKKFIVDLGDDFGGRKEFISQYDMIFFLYENLPKYNGKVQVNGQMKKEWYKNKYFDKFQINSVYAVSEEHKNRLMITADIYYRKDCVDKESWKTDKIITIDGYIEQYVNKEEGNKLIPQTFVFNGSKYNPENEKHKKLLDYKLKYVEPKSKKWQHLMWDVVLVNGAEEIEFDESQLTDAQREQLELGIRKLEDFKPNGSIYGERVIQYRLFEPQLKKISDDIDFSEGFLDVDLTDKEFEAQIFVPAKNEKLSEVMKEAEKKEEKTEEESEEKEVDIDDEIDDEDLF